jgi:hypothetical protein
MRAFLCLSLLVLTVSSAGAEEKAANGISDQTGSTSLDKKINGDSVEETTTSTGKNGVAPPAPPVTNGNNKHDSHIGTPSFFKGETLVYEVRFLGVAAGTAILSVNDPITFNGYEVYPILSTVQSNDFVSFFYPVNDRVESYLDAKELYSHRINMKQHQGKRKRKKQIEFDQVKHKAVQIKEDARETFDIPPKVNDFLSALYYFRAQRSIEVGRSVFIDVHEGEKNWKLEILVLGKETVITPMGTFETIKTQATPHYEGIFLSKGDLYIWMTNDTQRIPVKIESKIKVGQITISLVSKQGG